MGYCIARRTLPILSHNWRRSLSSLLIGTSLLAFPAGAKSAASPCRSAATGDLRFHMLKSKLLHNSRTLRILLPPAYDAPESKSTQYPVLYMLDGEDLFDVCENTRRHQDWKFDKTVYRLIGEKTISPMIVVGIDSAAGDRNRTREYLPYQDVANESPFAEPRGNRLPFFVTDEVMPFVAKRYRVLHDHDHTGIGGSSYGGIAALYSLLAKPHRFGLALIESPPLWVGMGQLVRDTSPLIAHPVRIYIGIGENEVPVPRYAAQSVELVRQLQANFKAAGYDDTNMRVVVEPGGEHSTEDWARRLPAALTFLYGP
jgi:predicted alpha/beta superfamily hydrolase